MLAARSIGQKTGDFAYFHAHGPHDFVDSVQRGVWARWEQRSCISPAADWSGSMASEHRAFFESYRIRIMARNGSARRRSSRGDLRYRRARGSARMQRYIERIY